MRIRLSLPRAAVALAAALTAGIGVAVWSMSQPVTAPSRPAANSSKLAKVVRMDLVTTQPVAGTIGYGPTTTLVAPGAASEAELSQARATINSATTRLAGDRAALNDTIAVNDASLSAAQATLTSDQNQLNADCAASSASLVCTQDHARVASDEAALTSTRARNQQTLDQAQAVVSQDQASLANAQSQAAPLLNTSGSGGTSFTSLPGVGSIVKNGEVLYGVDGRPVPLFNGAQAAHRVLCVGVTGTDVRQLEQNLLDLGYANSSNLIADGRFTSADAAAVRRWQAALGVPQTGVVNLGDVVFSSAPLRVVTLHVSAGAPLQPGAPIMDVSAATRLVSVQLSPALAYSVKAGDPVTVDLPDGTTRLPGTVSGVSSVAQVSIGSTAQTQNGAPPTTIPATITLSDPSKLPALDAAPVTVDITTQSAKGVLAVPVNALLALEGGGYAVEIPDPSGQGTHLVRVQTGIFDNSMVEVSGTGLTEGISVVVAE